MSSKTETKPMQAQPITTEAKPRKGRPPVRDEDDRGAFERWIEASGMTRQEVAAKLGIGKSTLFSHLRGDRLPSLEVAVLIEEFTGGAVPPKSWIKK